MHSAENYSIADSPVDLTDVFARESIVAIPPRADKPEVLTRLVTSLARAGRLPCENVVAVIDALQEREHYGTTGLGKGLALPHLRTRTVTDFAGAIGVAPTGIDFSSLDGLPTRLIILLLSPFDQRAMHSEIMGRLATLLVNRTFQYSVQLPRLPEALLRFLAF